VKLSKDDLDWFKFSVEDIKAFDVELIVVTNGESGINGFSKGETIEVPGVNVQVVDTVGAGDTVGAVLVEGILKFGDELVSNLQEVLYRAALAAAITCTRAGAKPPNFEELNK
jgi:fructokinase